MKKKKRKVAEPTNENIAPVITPEEKGTIEDYFAKYYRAYKNDYISQYYKAYKDLKAKQPIETDSDENKK